MQVLVWIEPVEQDDNGERRQRVDGAAHGVDRAQPGLGDEQHDVGLERTRERGRVAVLGQRRAHPSGRLDQSQREAARPDDLPDELAERESRTPQGLGRHGRREREWVPAMPRADPVRVFARRRGQHVGIGRSAVPGIE